MKFRLLFVFLLATLPSYAGDSLARLRLDGAITAASAEKLIGELTVQADAKLIMLEIFSNGGEVDAGQKIAEAIQNSPVPIICLVNLNAGSISLHAFLSCPVRLMTKGATLLAHEPFLTWDEPTWLTRAELREYLAELDKMLDRMAEHFADRTLVTKAEYLAKVSSGDWIIGADEALRIGAIHHIVSSSASAEAIAMAALLDTPQALSLATLIGETPDPHGVVRLIQRALRREPVAQAGSQ